MSKTRKYKFSIYKIYAIIIRNCNQRTALNYASHIRYCLKNVESPSDIETLFDTMKGEYSQSTLYARRAAWRSFTDLLTGIQDNDINLLQLLQPFIHIKLQFIKKPATYLETLQFLVDTGIMPVQPDYKIASELYHNVKKVGDCRHYTPDCREIIGQVTSDIIKSAIYKKSLQFQDRTSAKSNPKTE